jgi:hypothetical protein
MKPDLLNECNDQRIPPREFKETFCKRCRNQNCVNAGWSSSSFEERVRTQVDRLLTHPLQAQPDDPRFDHVRAMHFVEIAAALSIARRADPWVGPGVHLAEPDPETAKSQVVEDAVSKLAEARGRRLPTVIAIQEEVSVEEPPVEEPPVEEPPVEDVPPLPVALGINTDFPEEGVMIGGGSPKVSAPVSEDTWAPKPKVNVVPRGAKIKMGG